MPCPELVLILSCRQFSAVIPVWVQEVINSYHSDATATALLQELALDSPNA
jgi:hypothetical protein